VRRRLRRCAPFGGLADLPKQTDEQLADSDGRRLCPATGQSVPQSFEAQRRLLRPLPLLPEPFDRTATRTVQRDGTVNFAGRVYRVPLLRASWQVQVPGCAWVVQVWHEGQVVAEHPRHSQQRLLLDPSHYEGEGDGRVAAPVPLGQRGRKLQEILRMPVEKRPLDLEAALAEGTR
jgi:hypothetical protein